MTGCRPDAVSVQSVGAPLQITEQLLYFQELRSEDASMQMKEITAGSCGTQPGRVIISRTLTPRRTEQHLTHISPHDSVMSAMSAQP